jgi:toxin HigB-1
MADYNIVQDRIITYADKGTRDIAHGINSKEARGKLNLKDHPRAQRRIFYLVNAASLRDLTWPGLNLHALKRERRGQHAIRINDQYRVCFTWTARGIENIQITDYH